ncbi:hypothetical protein N1032_25430, partial [Herbiconiux sp. CPCC 203386]|nr:hypothetical protein [Herbiconiux daphne]
TATSETVESTDSELPPTVPNKVVEQTNQVPQKTAEPVIHEEHHAEPAKPEPKKQEPKQEPKQEKKHGDWRDIHAPSAQIPKTDKEKPAVPTKQEAKKAVDKLVKQSAEVKTLPKTGEENSLLSGMLSFFGIFLVSGVIIYGLEKLVKKGFFK